MHPLVFPLSTRSTPIYAHTNTYTGILERMTTHSPKDNENYMMDTYLQTVGDCSDEMVSSILEDEEAHTSRFDEWVLGLLYGSNSLYGPGASIESVESKGDGVKQESGSDINIESDSIRKMDTSHSASTVSGVDEQEDSMVDQDVECAVTTPDVAAAVTQHNTVGPVYSSSLMSCHRCGTSNPAHMVVVWRKQTRSADEGMTTLHACKVCQNRWKSC